MRGKTEVMEQISGSFCGFQIYTVPPWHSPSVGVVTVRVSQRLKEPVPQLPHIRHRISKEIGKRLLLLESAAMYIHGIVGEHWVEVHNVSCVRVVHFST